MRGERILWNKYAQIFFFLNWANINFPRTFLNPPRNGDVLGQRHSYHSLWTSPRTRVALRNNCEGTGGWGGNMADVWLSLWELQGHDGAGVGTSPKEPGNVAGNTVFSLPVPPSHSLCIQPGFNQNHYFVNLKMKGSSNLTHRAYVWSSS